MEERNRMNVHGLLTDPMQPASHVHQWSRTRTASLHN